MSVSITIKITDNYSVINYGIDDRNDNNIYEFRHKYILWIVFC